MKIKYRNLTGLKFGRLTVKQIDKIDKNRDYRVYWKCICDCGKEKNIRSDNFTCGYIKSCGCLMIETSKINQHKMCYKHGMSGSIIHNTYKSIRQRCLNKNSLHYKNYGGRGIKFKWKNFEDFYHDMGDPPSSGYSIDRIDNNGNYCKENCRWATKKEQANNRRTNKIIFYKGEGKNIKQWAEKFNIPYKRFWRRLNISNWRFKKAIKK